MFARYLLDNPRTRATVYAEWLDGWYVSAPLSQEDRDAALLEWDDYPCPSLFPAPAFVLDDWKIVVCAPCLTPYVSPR